MSEFLNKTGQQIMEFINGLSPGKRISLGATTIAILAGIGLLFAWAGRTNYIPLMSNLNSEDSANVIRFLREKNIPFIVDSGGKTLSVPSEVLHETRLALATQVMPQTGTIGYEIFDKQSLGTTSFIQKLNQKRAREGELMRTIQTIKGVKRSRVHLAIPEKSAFVEDQKKPTASVVLDIEPGTLLSEKQVYGIANLVSRAVEGMDSTDVSIVDSNGKLLSKNASDPLAAATASQLDFRRKIEQDLEGRIEGMLKRIVGEGRVVATVSADLDFAQVNETQTIYDQEGAAVRSTEKNTHTMEGSRPGPGGPAGATSNTPGQPVDGGAVRPSNEIRNDNRRMSEVTNYAVPQTVRNTTRPSGQVRKLSVAVVVDGKRSKTTGKDGGVQTKVEPWGEEKLKEFEAIVMSAAAIDKKRGDTLEVKNLEFAVEDLDEAERALAAADQREYIKKMVSYAVVALGIVLFFLFPVRHFIRWVTENTIDSVDTLLPQTIEELEKLQRGAALPGMEDAIPQVPDSIDPEKVEGQVIKDKITTLVDANPHKAALILKDWLSESRPKKAEEKDGKAKGA